MNENEFKKLLREYENWAEEKKQSVLLDDKSPCKISFWEGQKAAANTIEFLLTQRMS